ncbi:MAG: PilZ domain-containing protein [Nitrospira sp.]|nr:PilZ domain-containing protein [Nitrospira sp.]
MRFRKKRLFFYAKDASSEAGPSSCQSETRERRGQPRFSAQFRSCLSGGQLEGQGRTVDISAGGCKIESEVTVPPGTVLECRIYIPGLDWPLRIDEAQVKWTKGNVFGVLFTGVNPQEREKLKMVLAELEREA